MLALRGRHIIDATPNPFLLLRVKMAETPVIPLIHDFDAQPRGVDTMPHKGLRVPDGVNYGVLMFSSKGGVDSSSETLTQQGVYSELPTNWVKLD